MMPSLVSVAIFSSSYIVTALLFDTPTLMNEDPSSECMYTVPFEIFSGNAFTRAKSILTFDGIKYIDYI